MWDIAWVCPALSCCLSHRDGYSQFLREMIIQPGISKAKSGCSREDVTMEDHVSPPVLNLKDNVRLKSVEDKSPACLSQARQQESDPVYTHRRPTGRRQSSCLQPSLSVWPQISFCVWGWGVWAGLQLPLWSLFSP